MMMMMFAEKLSCTPALLGLSVLATFVGLSVLAICVGHNEEKAADII